MIVSVMFLLWRLIKFPLYISPENIPNELIDISFFSNLLKNVIQAKVQSAGYVATSGETQLNILNTIQNWNLFLSIFLGLPLFYLGLYQVKMLGEKLLKVEVFCCAIMMVSLVISIALLLMTKMPPVIDTKGVLLLFISIFSTVISFTVRSELDGQSNFEKSI
ncbi:hypothetical protein N752_27185 [Desulforamulus aquiferis]|nr:hypothetical protein N752_27185 [Desulforamulus aquiferis]